MISSHTVTPEQILAIILQTAWPLLLVVALVLTVMFVLALAAPKERVVRVGARQGASAWSPSTAPRTWPSGPASRPVRPHAVLGSARIVPAMESDTSAPRGHAQQ